MKIICLKPPEKTYGCNPYMVLGSWNRIDDINSLIDPGPDDSVIDQIEKVSTGVGKNRVELIILTHNHFDHAAGAIAVKKRYGAKIAAYFPGDGVDTILKDGDCLKLGDAYFQVIHSPIHSADSICLFENENKVLFTGDTPVRILSSDGSHKKYHLDFLMKIRELKVKSVYSGHDPPLLENVDKIINSSLEQVKKSLNLKKGVLK